MPDLNRLKQAHDLRLLVEQDLGRPISRSARASLWKCPFHNERRGASLAVWADGYRCFGACAHGGDLFDWLQRYRQLSFAEALDLLGETTIPLPPPRRPHESTEPPAFEWQEAARKVVEYAEEKLWSLEGQSALTYLFQRGLTSRTIKAARLGYIPGWYHGWHSLYGLTIPCGIVIPWFAAGALWAVKVRRAFGEPKYAQIAGGSSHGLYNADALEDRSRALICEGEFDTLIAQQEAGEMVAAVSLGSASATLAIRWYSALVTCSDVLVAYDNDAAGEKGAQRLCDLSPRFRTIRVPHGKDITAFYLSGGDVYGWVELTLRKRLCGDT
ncbi:MAG: toprim domain-containing protein [Anaerolinea sp.]|nr:toprim domain-containing protein [Anaerolinea sp.]